MNILDSIEIHGLWASLNKPLKFSLDSNFNFLIGKNGSGKTTVINLLAAALEADFERLDKIEFTKIAIKLKSVESRTKPKIEIHKKQKPNLPYYDITYYFYESTTANPVKFDLDVLAEERAFRGLPPRVLREKFFKEKFLDIQRQLESVVRVCWLSVNRHSDDSDTPDRVSRSSVDRKLESLLFELGKYFTFLSSRFSGETREFQKQSLLSLLTPDEENVLKSFSENIDIEEEKRSLSKAFELLGMQPGEYERKINTHFSKFSNARKAFSQSNPFTVSQFSAIYNGWKSHGLVQLYNKLTKKKSEIFKPRQTFVEVVNKLFSGRKYVEISDRNELKIFAGDRDIPIYDLSSGEKQLLIILGEALLQREESTIYIADEPELSLHVSWQEQLTTAISVLNPNSQIIFATHSPDIISVHSERVINMEELVP